MLLILPPRITEDSVRVRRAAIKSGWQVLRLQGWRVATLPAVERISIYGEPLFARMVAAQCERVLLGTSAGLAHATRTGIRATQGYRWCLRRPRYGQTASIHKAGG